MSLTTMALCCIQVIAHGTENVDMMKDLYNCEINHAGPI